MSRCKSAQPPAFYDLLNASGRDRAAAFIELAALSLAGDARLS